MTSRIKTPAEIEKMREAGRRAAAILDAITPHVQPGITTGELDQLCHRHIEALDCIPAPLNYRGFPKATCISVNHVICHGIPGNKKLKRGDILNIDVTVIYQGWHGDTSRMYFAGEPGIQAQRVTEVARDALAAGISQVVPGARLGDIGHAIQTLAEARGCSVVREYCGHGIGQVFHEEPQVLHYGKAGTGESLRPGMTFTIEPMINAGRPETRLLGDQWTVVTKDHSLSAQWEHTIAVTETGVDILTLSDSA
ncbi:MAG: type I methionyl aminopeptidase [Spiribacter sp.]|jgi:methionyl aminopeptidase|nr:type I methionyl aminopeptidase [Spiribacter sp.]MDR9489312.1 type I methionyl aminopeptidase [Spiribacter sp.]